MDGYKPGDVILGRYEVTAVLGQGGMGYVLAAQDRRLGRLVALKFLLASLRDKPHVAARFEREARTATRIVDEHVARVHTVELTPEGVPFIVMEHLRGDDLGAVIRARGQLPIDESVDLLLQACEALAQAHKLGIVHRDLKPSNLFRTATFDGTPILKVLDFGIAKALPSDDTSLTATDGFLGSPAYMSPEQLRAEEVDARSDVWALGVILYEMLAATPPFTGPSVPAVCAAILDGAFADLSTHRPDVSPALEEVLTEAICLDPEWRLPSVEAFAAKLAPLGTEGARASYARIRRIASTTEEPASAPREPANASALLAGVGATSADRPTSVTQGSSEPSSTPPHYRRALGIALGAAATAAVALGFVRARAMPTQSVAAAPTSESAPLASASVGAKAPQDPGQALVLYEAACRSGKATACVNEGAMLFEGTGVPRDEAAAAPLFLHGCEGGEPLGCLNVSVAYREGRGVPKDFERAYEFADHACTGGALAGCTRMAAAKVLGEGVARDVKGGLAQLDALCKRGETSACDRAAGFSAKGMGTDVPADSLRVREAAQRGCKGGSGLDCQVKKTLDTQDTTSGSNARGWALFQTRCDSGMMSACGMLGDSLILGSWGVVDRPKGTALREKACKGGYAPSCKALGDADGR